MGIEVLPICYQYIMSYDKLRAQNRRVDRNRRTRSASLKKDIL